jgi:hypothetical protein
MEAGNRPLYEIIRCLKPTSGMCVTKELRATTVQPGPGSEKMKPLFETLNGCIFLLNGSFLGGRCLGFCERWSQDPINGTNIAS